MRALLILACWLLASPVWAQSMGVLSTPINVTPVSITSATTTAIVAAQGSGIKIRVLGFFASAQNQVLLNVQDATGTACPGILLIGSSGQANVPVSPPGYLCETAANQALNVVSSQGVAPINARLIVIWQASQ